MHALIVIVKILPYQFEPESDLENIDEENRKEPVQTRILARCFNAVSCLFSSCHTFNWLNCNVKC